MESRYGIGINNRYAMFLDSDEEGTEDIIKPESKSIKTAGKATPNNNNNDLKKKQSKETQPKLNNKEDKENRATDKFQGKPKNGSLESRKPQESREDRNNRRNKPEDGGPPRTFEGGRGRGRGRGGADRGRGGGRGRPRREFERKSGDDRTGVKPVDKREGGGSHNWGTFQDDIKAEDDKAVEDPSNQSGEAKENGEELDTSREEEPKTLTLEEYKAQQRRDTPKYNTRKAGEGSEIDPKWKKTYAYKKEKESLDDEDDEEPELYPQRVNRQKRVLDIEFSFTDGNGAPRGRGGRGGGRGRPRGDSNGEPRSERRGRGGRGGPGRGPYSSAAPNVNDEESFPTLGLK